jgi:cell division septal protein FtsQ
MKTRTGKKVKTKRSARKVKTRGASSTAARAIGQYVLPLAICGCLLICLGAIGFLGFERVAASEFFEVRNVDVVGVERASKQGIEASIKAETERAGVWRTDLTELKAKIEKLPFVKSASVTRVLPDGIRVQLIERQPQAVVLMGGIPNLVDAEGSILAAANGKEKDLPFVMTGWDESKTEKAWKENIERVKIYQKMIEEWRAANVLDRVERVEMNDLREPRAIVGDSGTTVSIAVGRDDYGANLVRGIKAIVGKGDVFGGVNLVGGNMILTPRKAN